MPTKVEKPAESDRKNRDFPDFPFLAYYSLNIT